MYMHITYSSLTVPLIPNMHTIGASPKDDNDLLSAGDTARVELDPDLFKIAQQNHGGWIDGMAEVRGSLPPLA